jgi:hypothetical protein
MVAWGEDGEENGALESCDQRKSLLSAILIDGMSAAFLGKARETAAGMIHLG